MNQLSSGRGNNTGAAPPSAIADIIRTGAAPVLFPTAMTFEAAREYLFRTVSQITLNYRGGPLSAGSAGRVRGGDRLPWVGSEAMDNFAPLSAIAWQVHVYGSANPQRKAPGGAPPNPLPLLCCENCASE